MLTPKPGVSLGGAYLPDAFWEQKHPHTKTISEGNAMSFETKEHAKQYWRENLKLMLTLLSVWFVVSYGAGILLVDALNEIRLFGFKLGFWFAQQGAIYTFIVLIFVYVKKMNALDKKYNVQED
jgi:putative solute:sodium symporter small subunit